VTSSEPILVLDDVSVRYPASASGGSSGDPVAAVRGVSLTLARRGSLGLAGESGCGKSTLANAILRLLPAGTTIDGRIELGGDDVGAMNPGRLRAIRWTRAAIVFQGALHALNPVQRILDQVAEPMLIHDTVPSRAAAAERVRTLLEQVGLPGDRADAHPHQLSGGQRQRVLIAMALACEPDLLIADEPTTALDVMVQAQVLALLASLRAERNFSMIFITHDLSLLADVCDRLAVMYAGRVVEEGPSEQVLRAGHHPYTQALAAAFPIIGDPVSRLAPSGLPGDPPDPAALPTGCAFHPRCPMAVDRCAVEDPVLRVTGSERSAACLLVGERTS